MIIGNEKLAKCKMRLNWQSLDCSDQNALLESIDAFKSKLPLFYKWVDNISYEWNQTKLQ